MTRIDDPEKLRVVTGEALAESLNHAGIHYVLINGLYGYPAGIGRDLDILVRPEDVPGIVERCEEVGAKLGWDRLLVRWSPYGTWQLYLIRKDADRLSWLEVDPMLKDTMVLGAAYLLDEWGKASGFGVDYYRGPFPVSKLGHYVKSQLRPILYGDLARFKHKYALEVVNDPDIVRYLQELLGPSMADQFCMATQSGVEGVTGLGKRLKWAINSRYLSRHPLRAMRNMVWSRLIRPFKLYWLTAGLVVQVVGPDIKDKVEILNEAKKYFNGCFEVRIKEQWFNPGEEKSASSKRRPAPLVHWVRILAQALRLTWRYYAKDRFMPRSVIQFVLYGGGLADVELEPARYGFRSAAGMPLLQRFVPPAIEIILLPQISAQTGQPSGAGRNSSPSDQPQTWCTWAYNDSKRNVVIASDSAEESGYKLAIAILEEIEARFAVSECGELQRVRTKYSQEKRVLEQM
jgi:hypothetical protein